MNTNKLILEIEERISAINEIIPDYWPKSFYDKWIENDIDTLEKLVKKVNRWFWTALFCLIAISVLLIIVLSIKKFNGINTVSINGIGLLILNSAVIIRSAFKNYSVKLNLENKIYLLRLLEQLKGCSLI